MKFPYCDGEYLVAMLHMLETVPADPEQMRQVYRMEGMRLLSTTNYLGRLIPKQANPPLNFQQIILWAMYTSPGASEEVKKYVAERY